MSGAGSKRASGDAANALVATIARELAGLSRMYRIQAAIVSTFVTRSGLELSKESSQALQRHDAIVQEIEAISAVLGDLAAHAGMGSSLPRAAAAKAVAEALDRIKLGGLKDRLSGRPARRAAGTTGDGLWD